MDALLEGGVGDAGGGEADALVDHLDAGIAGGDGDLHGTVAVAVEAGLADQHPEVAGEAGVRGTAERLALYHGQGPRGWRFAGRFGLAGHRRLGRRGGHGHLRRVVPRR